MRVVVPFAGHLDASVAASVAAANPWGLSQQWRDVSGSDRAYFDLLAGLWARAETFVVVEHDIVIHGSALAELRDCPHDWCSFPFEYEGRLTHGLGCVKFSADLILRQSDALTRVGVISDDSHPKRHWCRLDAWLTCVLESGDERRHEHKTVVRHLNPHRSHSCPNK